MNSHVLKIYICHNDKFGRNKTIGEINIPLKIEDFTNSQNTTGERSYDFEMYKVGTNLDFILYIIIFNHFSLIFFGLNDLIDAL